MSKRAVILHKVDKFSFDSANDVVIIEGSNIEITDTYHSMDELYAHRIILFLCLLKSHKELSWKSRLHSDGTKLDDWFIAGMNLPTGQITYHIPDTYWNTMESIKTLEKAPEFDGHTSNDVLIRLNNFSFILNEGDEK